MNGTVENNSARSSQHCVRNVNDPRPDTDAAPQDAHRQREGRLSYLLGEKTWATAEAVPCIQQMLQVENHEIRRM